MVKQKLQIGVIGDSECSDEEKQLAYEIGLEIGKINLVLICGGHGGIMEAASRGCKEAGGLVVGILPSNSRLEGNSYLDVQIPTGLGWTRNSLVALSSDALIAIGGRSGTLSEIAFGWMYDKPVIALDHSAIREMAWSRKLAGQALDERRGSEVIWPAKTAKDAVSQAVKLAHKDRGDGKKL